MDAILDQIFALLTRVESASVIIAIVVDGVFRLIPTKKPLSLLYVSGDVIEKTGALLLKVSQVLDKVLPQKLSVDKPKDEKPV